MINNSGKELPQYRAQQPDLKIDHRLQNLGGGIRSQEKMDLCQYIPKPFAIQDATETVTQNKCQNSNVLFHKTNFSGTWQG